MRSREVQTWPFAIRTLLLSLKYFSITISGIIIIAGSWPAHLARNTSLHIPFCSCSRYCEGYHRADSYPGYMLGSLARNRDSFLRRKRPEAAALSVLANRLYHTDASRRSSLSSCPRGSSAHCRVGEISYDVVFFARNLSPSAKAACRLPSRSFSSL